MTLIEKFVEKVRKEDNSFAIETPFTKDRTQTHYFVQSKVGNAKLVYGDYSSYYEDFYMTRDYKPELCAIVTDNIIYILDEFLFCVRGKEYYPAGVVYYYDYVNEIKKYVKENLFTEFWNNLVVNVDISNVNDNLKPIEPIARAILFSSNIESALSKYEYENKCPLESVDYVKNLCGKISIEDEVISRFNVEKEKMAACKRGYETLKKLIETKIIAEDWELEMLNGLNSVDAKTVNVTFEFNENCETAKISVDTLRYVLQHKYYFSDSYFCNQKQAKEMVKNLGATTFSSKGDVLTCEHIVKITYGKNVLYQK